MKKIVTLVCMTLILMALPAIVGADTVALQPTGGTILNTSSAPQNANGWTVGWSFWSTDSIKVTALGFFDEGQDGLSYAHEVGLWNENGTLLVSATVPIGTTGELTGDFRFVSLANPITLSAGLRYYVGSLYLSSYTSDNQPNGLVPDNLLMNVASLNPAPGIAYDVQRAASNYSLSLLFPDWMPTNNTSNGYFGPNFEIETGGGATGRVSEPATMLLLGLGLIGVAGVRRKIKK